jgi:AraC family transcriptional regulator, regulatory protein of adaptative response / DNA-3-methyladenine glycosylase II
MVAMLASSWRSPAAGDAGLRPPPTPCARRLELQIGGSAVATPYGRHVQRVPGRCTRGSPDPDGSSEVSGCGQLPRRRNGITASVEAFTAVVTTGIYCQPACSARPRAENTRPFALAAAAEAAGYRACMRCRPYRYPQTIEWSAPEFVCRGVRLILDGALDRGSEDDLAHRLGISARHLRRLFTLHLGVTPDGLARSARVHFARRLLDDTDLSVTEVAFAAGFGSLRQFNRACRDVFRESPRALRARRRKADRLVADGGLSLRLAFVGELDWPAMLDYFASCAIRGVERVDGDTYRRTIVVDGYPGVLELSPGGRDHLVLRAHLPRWGELVHIVQRARAIANLDLCLEEPEQALRQDPLIGRLLRARPGLRPPGTWDAFETGVHAILAEGATLARANRLCARIVERFGTRVSGLERLGLTHTLPAPAALAAADLGEVGVARARGAAIRAFARAVGDDQVRLDRSIGLEQLTGSLSSLDGVDASTAHYIALRLGEPDAFPVDAHGFRGVVPNIAADVARELADGWRPWRALALTHLWNADADEDTPARRDMAA